MQEIERFTPTARWVHWVHTAAFIELALSGFLIYLPWFGPWMAGSVGAWIRVIHRAGVVVFVLPPIVYAVLHPARTWYFFKEAFTWERDDFGWMKAAPGYYFGSDARLMPPQGYINTGEKLFRLAMIFGVAAFVVTGAIMWFFKGMVAPVVYQWSLLIHDVCFILALCFLFLHVQLAMLHPRMDEGLLAMIDGKVSGLYAKSHHGKWYDQISKENDGSTTSS